MTANTRQPRIQAAALPHGKALRWLAHIGPATLTVLFMWLPFGFALTGLLEEWGVVGLFSRIGVFFLTDVASAMPAHALRPLTILPHAIAYSLDPNSFKYWHVLLIIALLIKGWTVSIITIHITGALNWGMLASVLVIVFPADTMQLSFRSIHINWALSLTLLASILFLQALEQKTEVRSLLLSAVASLLLAAGCAMYEVALLLVPLPAFVIFIQIGVKGLSAHIKQFYRQHLAWLIGPIFYIAYVIHVLPLVDTYQSAVIGDSALTSFKTYFPKIFSLGITRSLVGGWIDAIRITCTEIGSYWYILLATATLMAPIEFTAKRSTNTVHLDDKRQPEWALIRRMIALGIILTGMGYAPFIFNPAHMAVSQRTFLYAAPGATLVFIALFLIVHRYSKIATATLAALMISTGLATQLFQFQHYIDISRRQQSVLDQLAHNFDGNAVNKTLLILDYSNQLNHDWMFLNGDLSAILFHLYGKPVGAIEVCYMPGGVWQIADPLQRKGTCEETESGWSFNYPTPLIGGPGMSSALTPTAKKLRSSEVVTVVIGRDDIQNTSAKLSAHRRELVSGTLPLSVRLQGIIETSPRFDFLKFRNRSAKDEYYWDFGRWWSLAPPTAGSGWRDPEWRMRLFSNTASAWINAPYSSLNFELTPSAGTYIVSGQFNAFANEKVREVLQISLNGTAIPVHWSIDGSFSGEIPPATPDFGRNTLEFTSQIDVQSGVSAKLEWIKIARQRD